MISCNKILALILLTFMCISGNLMAGAQDRFEGIDTTTRLFVPEIARQSQLLARDFMNGLLQQSTVDSLVNICGLPFVSDGVRYKSRDDLKKHLLEVMLALRKNNPLPQIESTVVLGRRNQVLNDLMAIDVYFVLCTLRFDIDGQSPTKQVIFAVQMTDRPRIVGQSSE